jgi:hypothetical protein
MEDIEVPENVDEVAMLNNIKNDETFSSSSQDSEALVSIVVCSVLFL